MGGSSQRLGPAVNAGLDAQGQAVAQGVDLGDHVFGVAGVHCAPAHHLQHWAEDFRLQVGDTGHFKGVGRNQVDRMRMLAAHLNHLPNFKPHAVRS